MLPVIGLQPESPANCSLPGGLWLPLTSSLPQAIPPKTTQATAWSRDGCHDATGSSMGSAQSTRNQKRKRRVSKCQCKT